MMTPRQRAIFQIAILVGVAVTLLLFFPAAVAVMELAARELRFLWWIVLLVILAVWLIWGVSRKPKP